jgi:hypothetical protein
MMSTTAVAPIWLIKTRLQLQTNEMKRQGLAYKGSLDCIRRVYREEGLRGFYKGLAASYLGNLLFHRSFARSLFSTTGWLLCSHVRVCVHVMSVDQAWRAWPFSSACTRRARSSCSRARIVHKVRDLARLRFALAHHSRRDARARVRAQGKGSRRSSIWESHQAPRASPRSSPTRTRFSERGSESRGARRGATPVWCRPSGSSPRKRA